MHTSKRGVGGTEELTLTIVNIHGLAQAARGGRVQPGTHELHMGVAIGVVPHRGTLGQYWKGEGHSHHLLTLLSQNSH